MLKRIREMKDQDGFTLIELMVVVLIIAILIAIAIPTFLGLRERAQNRAAQTDLRNALTAAKTHYTDNETYLDPDAAGPLTVFNAAAGAAIEPSLTWNNSPVVAGEVSVYTFAADGDDVLLVGRSVSDDYFCIADNDGSTVQGNTNATTLATCTGSW